MSWGTQRLQADGGHSVGLEPTSFSHRGVGTSMLELEEQHVQRALLSAWTHLNPFPGGTHSAPTSAGLDADTSRVVAPRTLHKDTLANEEGQGLPAVWLLQCDATSLGPTPPRDGT